MRGCAERTGNIAKGCRDDSHAMALWPPFDLIHKAFERLKQCLSGLRDATAEDQDFRVKYVDDGSYGAGKLIH